MCEECARFERDLQVARERYRNAVRDRLMGTDSGGSAFCAGVEQALEEARFFCDVVSTHSAAHQSEHEQRDRVPAVWRAELPDQLSGIEPARA
jgi:hypothetical protein